MSTPPYKPATSDSEVTSREMPPSKLQFGPFHLPSSQVFYTSRSKLSFALVNLKPLMPGHVLICPTRVVPRFGKMTVLETTDLFLTVRRVSRMIERVYAAQAMNIAIQDGEAAGQSVAHVHVHVIPRKNGDMDERGGGDAIYEQLEGREGDVGEELRRRRESEQNGRRQFDAEEGRKARSEEEMAEEASILRRAMEEERVEDGEE